MKFHKTIQRRVHLRRGGHERLDSALRMCGTLYNAALEHRMTAYKATRDKPKLKRHSVTYVEQSHNLTGIRKDDPDGWGSISVDVGRGVLRRCDKAMQAFFRRVDSGETPGHPRFKKSARYRTIDVEAVSPSMVRVAGTKAHIRIKGLPGMELRCKTPLPPSESLKAIRITRYPIGVYASLSYEVEQEPLPPVRKRADAAVGIDMGVNKRAALSNGENALSTHPRIQT